MSTALFVSVSCKCTLFRSWEILLGVLENQESFKGDSQGILLPRISDFKEDLPFGYTLLFVTRGKFPELDRHSIN